jgi:multidrug efflux system membrane fusion protein
MLERQPSATSRGYRDQNLSTEKEAMPEDRPHEEIQPTSTADIADQLSEKKGRHRFGMVIVLAIALAIAVLVILRLRRPNVRPPAPPPVEIAMATAQKGSIPVYVDALGNVTPLATVTVLSRVDGQIMKVNYTEGQIVPAGFVLMEIDSRPFDAQVTTAQGQLQRDSEMLREANVNLQRFKDASAQGAIPRQQLEDQQSLVRQLEGTVMLDEGQLAAAKTQLDYCTIAAPVTGLVGLRRVDVGNIVHAADTSGLVVITQLQPITVVFSVSEDHLPAIQEQLRQGQKLPVEAWDAARQKKLATGALLAQDSQIDTTTGTIRLKAQFENKDDALFPNQFVNVRLLLNILNDVTLVPTGAIQRSAEGAFVYVVKEDHTLEMRPVEIGASEGAVTSVTKLEPGEVIAADNFNRLQEGTAVTERKAPSEPMPAAPEKPGAPEGAKS